MNEYLMAIGITFIILLIFAQIALLIKRARINRRLERETKEELKRIRRENKINQQSLKKIEKEIQRISKLSNSLKVKSTFKHLLKIMKHFEKLSKHNKKHIADEISSVLLGLFDDYYRFKYYNFARRTYDFLLEKIYPFVEEEKKELFYIELKNRYDLLSLIYNKKENSDYIHSKNT